MTSQEIADYICSKVGKTDDTSVALCLGFINARYRMIYDLYPWHDALYFGAITIGTDGFAPVPENAGRIVSAKIDEDNIPPASLPFLMESEPGILGDSGAPRFYVEFAQTDPSVRKLQFLPKPDASTAAAIVFKRVWQALEPSDEPVLRNIDNALIAAAMGDMLERQRQYAKAQAKFAEYDDRIKEVISLENEQSTILRRNRKKPDSGNINFGDFAEDVLSKLGTYDNNSLNLARMAVRKAYLQISRMALWKDLQFIFQMQADGNQVILPWYVDRVLGIRNGDSLTLTPTELTAMLQVDPEGFERVSGQSCKFGFLQPSGTHTLPLGQQLLVQSSAVGDVGPKIFLSGLYQGEVVSEFLVLNGTTAVQTANHYDEIYTFSKPVTKGSITAAMAEPVDELDPEVLSLNPREKARTHARLILFDTPACTQTLLVVAKRKLPYLIYDLDVPQIRGVENAIIAMGASDLAKSIGKPELVPIFDQESAAILKSLMDQETNQEARICVLVPWVEEAEGYDVFGGCLG